MDDNFGEGDDDEDYGGEESDGSVEDISSRIKNDYIAPPMTSTAK